MVLLFGGASLVRRLSSPPLAACDCGDGVPVRSTESSNNGTSTAFGIGGRCGPNCPCYETSSTGVLHVCWRRVKRRMNGARAPREPRDALGRRRRVVSRPSAGADKKVTSKQSIAAQNLPDGGTGTMPNVLVPPLEHFTDVSHMFDVLQLAFTKSILELVVVRARTALGRNARRTST